MTQDEIIEMANNAELCQCIWIDDGGEEIASLVAFAKLVAAKEREACAKLVEDSWMAFSRAPNHRLDITPFPELSYVAKVIRARGEA